MLFKQLVKGVKECHTNGIAHRDLKHLNILVSNAENIPKVKIADFGMAAKLQQGETIQKIAGTIGFMAPEIIRD